MSPSISPLLGWRKYNVYWVFIVGQALCHVLSIDYLILQQLNKINTDVILILQEQNPRHEEFK